MFLVLVIVPLLTLVLALYFLRPPKFLSKERKFEGLVVGHRGCRQFPGIPENNLASFRYAIKRGAQAIELDCRLTKDGEVVVIHDDNVWRLTQTKTGSISQMTLEEVKNLLFEVPIPNETSTEPFVERIPTLKEVMVLAKESKVKVFVEIKCIDVQSAKPLAQKVCALFKELEAHDWACVIAFNPLVLYYVRKYDPTIECCMLYCGDFFKTATTSNLETVHPFIAYSYHLLDPLLQILAKYILPEFIGCTMVGPHYRLVSPSDIDSFKQRGLSTYVWVPNTDNESAFFLKMNCSVGTDCVFPLPCENGFVSRAIGVTTSDD